MPIYEYECQECGKVFEKIQKFSDDPLTACLCEKEAPVRKLISAAAFHLKGDGWYVTDFRDKKKKDDKSKDKTEKTPESSDAKSGDGKAKGDGKDAEKSTAKKDGGSASSSASAD